MDNEQKMKVPTHISFIMDGNGRWAKERGYERTKGHEKAIESLNSIIKHAVKRGIKFMSVYAFSTENWNRPKKEVEFLMTLPRKIIKKHLKEFMDLNVKVKHIGFRDKLPKDTLNAIDEIEEKTKDNTGMVFVLAFNYGGRAEITETFKRLAKKVKLGFLNEDDITEEMISSELLTAEIPDPDLIIRTSGEERVSNYLLWQMAYSEFMFVLKKWPDFDAEELDKCLIDYQNRERRYGKI